jgi:hypothetical protein
MTTEPIPQGCLPFDLAKALAGHPVGLYSKKDLIANVTEIIKLSTLGCPFPVIIVTENDLKSGAFNESGEAYDCYYRLYLKKPEPKKAKVWIPVSKTKESHEDFAYYDTTIAYLYKDDAKNFIKNNWTDWQIIEAEIEVSE